MTEATYLVYKHTSPSGKAYVGLTNNYSQRSTKHRAKDNACRAFANALKKYGWDAFKHEFLAVGLTHEEAKVAEAKFIAEHGTISPNGYNLLSGGGAPVHCEETKALISERTRAGMTPEGIERTRQANMNREYSAEMRAKVSAANKARPPASRETRAKISAAAKARPPASPETRAKLSTAHKGKTKTRKHVAAIAAVMTPEKLKARGAASGKSRTGQKRSAQARANISAGHKAISPERQAELTAHRLSVMDMEAQAAKTKAHHASMTPEQKELRSQRIKAALAARTPEQKEARKAKLREAALRQHHG